MHIILVYLGVFIAIFFEGELVMISSLIAAHHSYLNIGWVIVLGFLATYCADVFYFFLGRKRGKIWLERNKQIHEKALAIQRKIDKHAVIVFITYRYLYGFRTITPIVIGASQIETRRFLIYSALNTSLWTVLISALGLGFSSLIESQLSHIEHIEKYFIAGFFVLGTILFVVHRIRSKNKE